MGRPAKAKGTKYKRTGVALPEEHLRHLRRLTDELAVRTHGQAPEYLEKQSVAAAMRWLIGQNIRRRTNNESGWRYYLNQDPAGNVVVEWENVYTDDRLIEGFDNTRPLSDGPVTAKGNVDLVRRMEKAIREKSKRAKPKP